MNTGDHEIIERAVTGLRATCTLHAIPESHGLAHALRVLAHADQALQATEPGVPAARALSVRLAALLHDADDRKYFPDCEENEYPNAFRIMMESGASAKEAEDAIQMIGLVSCSKNGNSFPAEAEKAPEILWPRWADRLEATGEVGVVRCWQYAIEKGNPLALPTSPRPKNEEEMWATATPERFDAYQWSGGKSSSMLDHYYDKLLRVSQPETALLRNAYFEEAMRQRVAPLVRVCLAFGATGEVPLDLLATMAARVDGKEQPPAKKAKTETTGAAPCGGHGREELVTASGRRDAQHRYQLQRFEQQMGQWQGF